MILLDVFNVAVDDILNNRFESAKQDPEQRVKLNYTVADFDGVAYHVSDGSDKKQLLVSIFIKFFNELKEHGVMEYLRKEYGDLLLQTPETGQSVTLAIDLDKLPENHAALARKCASLKRNCMASVFTKFFDLHANAGPTTPGIRAVIHYRTDETLYVQALHDRVTVIFSTMFKDPDDMLIGKVFMQEFTEARRRLDRAPQVLYSHRVPPAELQGTNAVVSDSVAYITFVLFPRHISSEASRQKSIDLIHTLRNYLHYHIKCSKAYIQMRMRAKTSEFLKVINRATVETSGTPVVNVAPTGEVSPLFAASLASKSAAAEATSGNRSMTVG
ncbi:Actin- protein 2/3 complex subunit 2-A [Clonorchis sinensis]|uniref:Arp2/3 complex 34 kDa subunit n=1 Tax=Clonorchis sinensis TaxID=79923 RepID=A0A8T1LX72_CLOSI|nr:Actin- protein 2/3 complex subunit 2-A [Clonorchis sinensis]